MEIPNEYILPRYISSNYTLIAKIFFQDFVGNFIFEI